MQDYIESEIKEYNSTITERLKLFLELFAYRSDIYIYSTWTKRKARFVPSKKAFSGGLSESKTNKLLKEKSLPVELIAFLSEIKNFKFEWDFSDRTSGKTGLDRGGNGGVINFSQLDKQIWYPKPEWQEELDYQEYSILDDIAAEGQALYTYPEGKNKEEAAIWFHYSGGDQEPYYMGTLSDYLRKGAQMAFASYWQIESQESAAIVNELQEKSIPESTTDNELIQKIIDRGFEAEKAEGLVKWLGKDLRIVFENS